MMLSLRYSTYDASPKNTYTKDTLFMSKPCLGKYENKAQANEMRMELARIRGNNTSNREEEADVVEALTLDRSRIPRLPF